jgi:threonine/homoserine/homoserine lactone efflux protein
MIPLIIQALTLGLSAAAAPGPFQAYLLSQTLTSGWRRALPLTLAPLVSDGPIITLVLLTLTQMPGWFLRGLQIAGGLFVIYLAWGAFRAFRANVDPTESTPPGQPRRSFLQAVLMNSLSPGPWTFWSFVIGPILIQAWAQSPALGAGFLLAFYATLIGSLIALVALFATARRLGPRVTHGLNGLSALALLVFGLYQIWQGMSG